MRHHFFATASVTALLLFLGTSAHAQEVAKVDETLLKSLYEQLLRSPNDTYIQKRIEDEREAIRDIIEEELQKLITPPPEEEQLDYEEFPQALERQQRVISSLEERLRNRLIDLDILVTEEKRFYQDGTQGSGVVLDEKYRLTKTYDGLLAKKAILEDRILVLEALIFQQNTRMDRLRYQKNIEQFSTFLSVGKYMLILLLVWFFERLVRVNVLIKITDIERRYTVTKVFTATVYLFAFAWLMAVVFAERPSILASFAIVGAGLAIALQDVVKDIIGWMFILQNKLYSTGDRITLGSHTGEVVDIGIFRTMILEVGVPPESVLEHTGKALSIPNTIVLNQPIVNHTTTSDYVHSEMNFVITFESNWRKAKSICEQILEEETREFADKENSQHRRRTRLLFVKVHEAGPHVYQDIGADGVEMVLKFSVPIGMKRQITTQITDKVMEAFSKEKTVELAYHTSRILAEVENLKRR